MVGVVVVVVGVPGVGGVVVMVVVGVPGVGGVVVVVGVSDCRA